MLDLAYEPDTVVEDVDDIEPRPPIVRGRVATKDLTVHVMTDDGYWHRLHPTETKTACDYPVAVRWVTRNGRYAEHPLATKRPDGEPCDCWTRAERAEADEEYRKKFGRDFAP